MNLWSFLKWKKTASLCDTDGTRTTLISTDKSDQFKCLWKAAVDLPDRPVYCVQTNNSCWFHWLFAEITASFCFIVFHMINYTQSDKTNINQINKGQMNPDKIKSTIRIIKWISSSLKRFADPLASSDSWPGVSEEQTKGTRHTLRPHCESVRQQWQYFKVCPQWHDSRTGVMCPLPPDLAGLLFFQGRMTVTTPAREEGVQRHSKSTKFKLMSELMHCFSPIITTSIFGCSPLCERWDPYSAPVYQSD